MKKCWSFQLNIFVFLYLSRCSQLSGTPCTILKHEFCRCSQLSVIHTLYNFKVWVSLYWFIQKRVLLLFIFSTQIKDKKQIQVIQLYGFKMRCQTVKTSCNINKTLDYQSMYNSTLIPKISLYMSVLVVRSIMKNFQQLTITKWGPSLKDTYTKQLTFRTTKYYLLDIHDNLKTQKKKKKKKKNLTNVCCINWRKKKKKLLLWQICLVILLHNKNNWFFDYIVMMKYRLYMTFVMMMKYGLYHHYHDVPLAWIFLNLSHNSSLIHCSPQVFQATSCINTELL